MPNIFHMVYSEVIKNISQYFDSGIPIQIGSTDGRQTAISVSANVVEIGKTICNCSSAKFRIDVFYQSAMSTNSEKIECLDNMLSLLHFLIKNLSPMLGECEIVAYPSFVAKNSNGLDVCEISLNTSMLVTPNGN